MMYGISWEDIKEVEKNSLQHIYNVCNYIINLLVDPKSDINFITDSYSCNGVYVTKNIYNNKEDVMILCNRCISGYINRGNLVKGDELFLNDVDFEGK